MTSDMLPFGSRLRAQMTSNLERFERRRDEVEGLRAAAVSVLITANDAHEACFVITRRAPRLGSHAGQWALPGGRIDAHETAVEAALRETREEVGLRIAASAVLGALDDYRTRSGYVITPFVAWIGPGADLEPNPDEVAEIHHVPLRVLEHPDVPRLRSIPESDRPVISIPMLGTNVHAPTAAILYQLREVALRGLDTRVDHFEQPVFAWR